MRLPSLLAVLLLASPLAAAAEAMPWPAWAPGDEWDTFVEFSAKGADGLTEHVAFVSKRIVVARETIRVGDADVDTVRVVELAQTVPSSDGPEKWAGKALEFDEGVAIEWFRASDGATVKSLRLEGTDVRDRRVTGFVRTYPAGCDLYGWPLAEGKSETRECLLVGDDGNGAQSSPFHPSTNVTKMESVDVPAGSFVAFVVDVGAEGIVGERQWYAPLACWRVKSTSDANALRTELLGYRCGGRSGGNLTTVDPPVDLALLGDPGRRAPAPAPLLAVAAVGLLALALRRRAL